MQKQDAVFLETFKERYQGFKDGLETYLLRKKALLEMRFRYKAFLKEYETQLSGIGTCENLTKEFQNSQNELGQIEQTFRDRTGKDQQRFDSGNEQLKELERQLGTS